ncbi:hypothetical protein CRG98_047736, partial [Punica granatum]
TGQGCKRHERGGSANLRLKKVNSHGLADRARLQEARARWLSELAMQESKLPLVANRARLQEAQARWLGELAMQESKLARISRPGKTRQGCTRYERGGSVNLRCQKLSSHGLLDPTMLQEARAKWLGELAMQGIKLARVNRPSKVDRGQGEVARRTCGAGK